MSKRSYMLTDEQLNILDGLVQYLTTPECVKSAISHSGDSIGFQIEEALEEPEDENEKEEGGAK